MCDENVMKIRKKTAKPKKFVHFSKRGMILTRRLVQRTRYIRGVLFLPDSFVTILLRALCYMLCEIVW